jgi:hypothetical protein
MWRHFDELAAPLGATDSPATDDHERSESVTLLVQRVQGRGSARQSHRHPECHSHEPEPHAVVNYIRDADVQPTRTRAAAPPGVRSQLSHLPVADSSHRSTLRVGLDLVQWPFMHLRVQR